LCLTLANLGLSSCDLALLLLPGRSLSCGSGLPRGCGLSLTLLPRRGGLKLLLLAGALLLLLRMRLVVAARFGSRLGCERCQHGRCHQQGNHRPFHWVGSSKLVPPRTKEQLSTLSGDPALNSLFRLRKCGEVRLRSGGRDTV